MRLALSLLLLASGASAQDAAIRVETSAPEARVLVDGAAAGAPGEVLPVASGERVVALVEPGWEGRRAETTVTVGAGDTLVVRLELPVRTRIESVPLRAEVALVRPDGRVEPLGPTPLVVDRLDGLEGVLTARLAGYVPAEVPAPEAGGRVTLVLRPEGVETAVPVPLPTERRNPRRTAIDVGLAGLALAAGAVAVHYKFRADRADDAYREPGSLSRGDEALRDEALYYDRLSGVALGVSAGGLGVLAIRLAIR